MSDEELIEQNLWDWKRRLTSWKLYKIKDKDGRSVDFIPNKYQLDLITRLSYKNLILKARQLWFSTIIQILFLDQALWVDNMSCGVIADTLNNAKQIFDNKIKFAYDNLPQWIKDLKKLKSDSVDTLKFENWSTIYVSTSFRWGTLQYLHVSEYGKICAKFPERAMEINTGALEAVAAGNYVFIESTAEGKEWDFYDKTQQAIKLQAQGKKLNEHEYKFFFYPWWEADEYVLYDEELVLEDDTLKYFIILEEEKGIVCTEEQKKWYQVKKEEKKENMFREYPSTPEEAFMAATEWSYYGKWVNEVYKTQRVCRVPYDKNLPVYVAWDLWGTGWWDNMDLWFFQIYWLEIRLIDWFTWIGYSIQDIHYDVLKDKPYNYDTMFLPHDAEVESMNDHKTRTVQLSELWYSVHVLQKTAISDRHNFVRDNFKYCYFDTEKCSKWLDTMKDYQRKWNVSTGAFMDESVKNRARNTADSFWYTIQAVTTVLRKKPTNSSTLKEKERRSAITGKVIKSASNRFDIRRPQKWRQISSWYLWATGRPL